MVCGLQEILRELADAEAYLAGIEKQYESTFLDLPPFKWCVERDQVWKW